VIYGRRLTLATARLAALAVDPETLELSLRPVARGERIDGERLLLGWARPVMRLEAAGGA